MNFVGFAVAIDGFYHDSPVILGAKTLEREGSKLPINGLTEIDRAPRQGMLRLGIKKKKEGTSREYPSEVNYFILDPETPDPVEKKRLIDLFHEEFGDKPKSISVMLGHSTINDAFPQNYKRYGMNTALKCIGDGETALCTDPQFVTGLKALTAQELQDREAKADPTRPIVWCAGRDCIYSIVNEKSNNKECKATATLSIEMPALGGIGVWQITTGSFNSILNINGFIRDMVRKFGRAHMLPLVLERREITTIFKGKKALHYPLYLNADKCMTEMMKQLAIPPERVLIETYTETIKELEAPAMIMDSEVPMDTAEEKPLLIDAKPVVEPEQVRHQGVTGEQGEPSKTPEPHPLVTTAKLANESKALQSANKALNASKQSGDSLTAVDDAEKHQEFLNDCKRDAGALDKPYNEAMEGAGYKKPAPSQESTETKPDIEAIINALPSNFFEFMNAAKKLFKNNEKEDMYMDILHRFSIKSLTIVKDDPNKQDAIMAETITVLQAEL